MLVYKMEATRERVAECELNTDKEKSCYALLTHEPSDEVEVVMFWLCNVFNFQFELQFQVSKNF